MAEVNPDFIRMSPRAKVHLLPARAALPTGMEGCSPRKPPPVGGTAEHAAEAITTVQGSEHEDHQLPSGGCDGTDEETYRIACWLGQIEIEADNRYNRTVIISPLPDSITAADVLPRIRGGVDSCYVSGFEGTRVAVVTFKLVADAVTYAEFCAESLIWGLWAFQTSRPGVPFTWERRAEVQLYRTAPGMGTSWNRWEIPTRAPNSIIAGSRCLVYRGCKPDEVAGIYRALSLHKSQHQRDQVECMWLDGPVRDGRGNPVRGSLHVWYTSVRAARAARTRVTWLEFEYDPCSDPPDRLLLHPDEGDHLPVFRHHEPFVNLVELDQKSILTGIHEGLVDPIQAYWRCRAAAHPAMPDGTADLAARLQWSLRNSGGAGEQPLVMAPVGHGPYTLGDQIPPPGHLTDPFVDPHPATGTAGPAQHQNRGLTYSIGSIGQSPQYRPFAAARDVPLGPQLSPLRAHMARCQARAYPPSMNNCNTNTNGVASLPNRPSGFLNVGTSDTFDTTVPRAAGENTACLYHAGWGGEAGNKYPNGVNDTPANLADAPQDSHVPGGPRVSAIHGTSPISDSSSPPSPALARPVSPKQATPAFADRGNDGGPGDDGRRPGGPGNAPDSPVETVSLTLRGGGLPVGADSPTSVDDPVSPPTPSPGRYSRGELHAQEAFWTCSLDEFRTMSDQQWASFGTSFYVAPEGFGTATRHTAELE